MGLGVKEYRRGIVKGVWQKLWHFHEDCPDYPTRDRKSKAKEHSLGQFAVLT